MYQYMCIQRSKHVFIINMWTHAWKSVPLSTAYNGNRMSKKYMYIYFWNHGLTQQRGKLADRQTWCREKWHKQTGYRCHPRDGHYMDRQVEKDSYSLADSIEATRCIVEKTLGMVLEKRKKNHHSQNISNETWEEMDKSWSTWKACE